MNLLRQKSGMVAFKILLILMGSVISAYGITLALYAGFGGATLAVLWQGISHTFGISIGLASFLVALVMIAFVLFYDIRQIHVGTVLYQVAYSAFVDLFADIHRYSAHPAVNFCIMLAGIAIFAMGTGVYASADLGRGSYEALTFALAEKNHWQVKFVRMALDAAMVIAGVCLGGKFGLCTVATVLLSGPIIQRTAGTMKKLLRRWAGTKNNDERQEKI